MKFLFRFIADRRLVLPAIVMLGMIALVRSEDAAPAPTSPPAAPAPPPPPPPEAKWIVIAECQMVVLPQKAALPLLPDLGEDEKIETAWARIQQMIDRGEATLIADLSVRGDAGARLSTESVEEVRYATEFTSPQLPEQLASGKAGDALKNWPFVGITPTAFETRNVGRMLDLQPKVSDDGKWVSMEVTPSHVRFLRFVKTDAGVLASGDHLSVEQPYFSSVKNTMALHVQSGQRVLVGVHKVPADENNMELFVLRVRTQPAGKTR